LLLVPRCRPRIPRGAVGKNRGSLSFLVQLTALKLPFQAVRILLMALSRLQEQAQGFHLLKLICTARNLIERFQSELQ